MAIRRTTGFLKSDKLLKVFIHIVYGIPPKRLLGDGGRPRWHFSVLSVLLAAIQWCSFCFVMYCAKTYWSGREGRREIPTETLLLLISLMFSGALSYSLLVVYFYHPRHQFEHQGKYQVFPHFTFAPRGEHKAIEPSPRNWFNTNVFMMLGICGVIFVIYCAFALNVFFDFFGIHNFFNYISGLERTFYYLSDGVLYWGYLNVVVACCVFYIMCQNMSRHVKFTEELIINEARDFRTARAFNECLLKYVENLSGTIKLWFVLHSILFIFITLSTVVEWIAVLKDIKREEILRILLAQTAGSLLIAFKYAFPFLAASRVTSRFDKMYDRISRMCHPDEFPEIDVFMSYCERCKAGFTVFGLKVTARLALFSFLSCFLGFLNVYKVLRR